METNRTDSKMITKEYINSMTADALRVLVMELQQINARLMCTIDDERRWQEVTSLRNDREKVRRDKCSSCTMSNDLGEHRRQVMGDVVPLCVRCCWDPNYFGKGMTLDDPWVVKIGVKDRHRPFNK